MTNKTTIVLELTDEEAEILTDLLGNLPAFALGRENDVLHDIFIALADTVGDDVEGRHFTAASYTFNDFPMENPND